MKLTKYFLKYLIDLTGTLIVFLILFHVLTWVQHSVGIEIKFIHKVEARK